MSECGDDITGNELLSLINRTNTSQNKLQSLSDLKDYILSEDLDANVIMISLLQDVSSKLNHLHKITENTQETNKLLKKILNPQ